VLPDPEASAAFLRARFGAAGIWIEVVDGGPGDDGLLDRTRRALVLRGYSPRTRKVYLGHIRRFLSRTGGDAENLAAAGSAQIAERYLFDLIGEGGVSRSYHSQVVSALRFLFETVLGNRDVALTIPRPRKERHLPDVMSPEQVAKILTKPRNLKHRALLMLLYSSGLRVSEIVRLRPGDLDPDRRTVKVRRGKGGKDRYTLLARRAAEAVRIYRESYGTGPWLFPGARHGRHLTPRSVQRIVQAAARAAGIETKVTPHTLRHSFATHLLESGTNLRIIQELLGHTSPTTTQIYTHVANTAIETVRSPLDNLADHEAPA
jgi:site-specific recombinase XerD